MQTEVEQSTKARGAIQSPSAFYALQFNFNVNNGIYTKEETPCFCGSFNHIVMSEKDRYGIDYKMCLCLDCGILYSNPRMTKESFKRFYENDYRNIYSDVGEESDTDNKMKELVDETLEDFDLPAPKVVFELGCGTGGNLTHFKDAYCIGVDYDSLAIEIGKLNGLNLHVGGIEKLEQTGKKNILNQVLEHLNDIESDLKRVRDLLTEDGLLYIAVPRLYGSHKKMLFQNAHNYQFTGNTLCYVMYVCGFEEYFISEEVRSLWHKSEFANKEHKNHEEYRPIESYLLHDNFIMPKVRLNSKFSLKKRRENITYAVNSGIPEISPLVNSQLDSSAVIIAGGPSINNYVEKIKQLQSDGSKIYSIERMYQWCLNNGIVPDYIVVLDASDDVIESFVTLHEDTTHIIVSQAIPEVFDRLKGSKSYHFNLLIKGIDFSKIYNRKEKSELTMINSGGSVSLCCLSIAQTFGARMFHMFGFDCHITGGDYCDGITGVGAINDTMDIEIDGRVFNTTPAYYAFMQQFFEMYQTAKDLNMLKDVKVYGDSMAKVAAKIDIDGDKKKGSR